MWGRFGQRSSRRSEAVNSRFGALANLRERFGRQEPKHEQPTYGGAVGFGVAVLAVLAAISLLLLLRRRSRGRGNSTEEVNEEVTAENEESAG
jgi:cytochrome b